MPNPENCQNLSEVRAEIDKIDHQLIDLIACRQGFVYQAAKFKTSPSEVRADDRVKAMLETRKQWALAKHLNLEFIQRLFKMMVSFFTGEELTKFDEITAKPNIIRAELKDAATLLTLQKLAYKTEAERYHNFCIEPLIETLEQTQSDLKQKIVLKAVVGDEMIGSVRGYEVEGTCYIGRLFVHPKYRGQGIGKALMNTIETYFPKVHRFELYTGWKSRANINMYMGLGFFPFKIEPIDNHAKLVYMEKII